MQGSVGSAALNLLSAGASLKMARAQRNAYNLEAAAAEQEARLIDLQTRQKSTNALNKLNGDLAAIEAIRAGRNLALDSPTGMAVAKAFARESMDAMDAEKLTGMVAARQRRISAMSSRIAGRGALIGGYVKAAGYLKDAAGDLAGAAGLGKKG